MGSQKRYQNKVDSKNLKTKFIRKKKGRIKSREFSFDKKKVENFLCLVCNNELIYKTYIYIYLHVYMNI